MKTLDSLVEQGKIREKVYNKQKLYVLDQVSFVSASASVHFAMFTSSYVSAQIF